MTFSPNQLLADLLALCPEFSTTWADQGYLSIDDDGTFTYCGVFLTFSDHIAGLLASKESPGLEAVFEYVERCMNDNEDISTAAATCFLESLINRTPGQIDPKRFVPLLGPESLDYCRAWDDVCGVRTEGLW